jgi:hypothetical protein
VPDDYLWLLFISFMFGLANAISHGTWQPIACALLGVTLGVLVWRFVVGGRTPSANDAATFRRAHVAAVFAMLLSLPLTALSDPKILAQAVTTAPLRAAELASVVLVASYAPYLSGRRVEPPWLRTGRFVAFGLVLLAAGVAVIHVTPKPEIDVWTIQMKGGEVLLDGKNPYVWANVPDTDPENDFTVPFVYPPAAVYASAIGVALFHDVRYVLLGTIFAAGLALRSITRRAQEGRGTGSVESLPALLEDAPALFFWQTPLLMMVVELSWLDPLQVMLISAGLATFVADKKTLAAVLFGVAVSSKQSMFFLFPLVGVVLRFDFKRWVVLSVSALLPVLPFMIWDFKALKHANFDFMSGLPPRRDALCFTNAVWKVSRLAFPASSGFLFGAVVVGIACLRALPPSFPFLRGMLRKTTTESRPPLAFSRALVLTYFVFFFFNRWAFANYYFLLTGLAALAGAAALHCEGPSLRSSS